MNWLRLSLLLSLVTSPSVLYGEANDRECEIQAVERFDGAPRVNEVLPSIQAVKVCNSASGVTSYLGLGPIHISANGYKYFQIRDLSQAPGENTHASLALSYEHLRANRYDGRWVTIDSETLNQEELSARVVESAALSQCIANQFCFHNAFAKSGFWSRLLKADLANRISKLDAALGNTSGTVLTVHYRSPNNLIVLMTVGASTVRVSLSTADGWTIEELSFVDL